MTAVVSTDGNFIKKVQDVFIASKIAQEDMTEMRHSTSLQSQALDCGKQDLHQFLFLNLKEYQITIDFSSYHHMMVILVSHRYSRRI